MTARATTYLDDHNASVSPTMARLMVVQIDNLGPFIVFKTLLGGPTDHNRRTIKNIITEERVATYNGEMHEWTPALEAQCAKRCLDMNYHWKLAADELMATNHAALMATMKAMRRAGCDEPMVETFHVGFAVSGDVRVTAKELLTVEALRAIADQEGV